MRSDLVRDSGTLSVSVKVAGTQAAHHDLKAKTPAGAILRIAGHERGGRVHFRWARARLVVDEEMLDYLANEEHEATMRRIRRRAAVTRYNDKRRNNA